MRRALFSLSLMLAAAFAAPRIASAEDVVAADAKGARSVVEGQLAAFAADDAQRAFAYATPGIRAMFGDPELFLTMVRSGYPVVYRHSSVSFLAPAWVEGTLLQGVHMTDSSGSVWLAIYQLERQADKSWRIAGCTVQAAAGKMT